MSGNIYALLVGINDYAPEVGKLSGCLNDVDQFHDYLTDSFDANALRIEVLKNADATRANIIAQFRGHLSRATEDDVVVFQYCGHGAQSKSASAFAQLYPDGKDEGFVCYDSRAPGGYDLADKEVAVLLAELAVHQPHIAVILDCCHSGSATRSADDFAQMTVRQTHERFDERPLDSYIDGYYAEQAKAGKPLEIPLSRHISLAACERVQKAWETKSFRRHGLFSSALFGILGQTGPEIAYADLFVRCRAQVRRLAENQEPQFETYQGFNAYRGFLGNRAARSTRRYSVHYVRDSGWQLDCGAIHGLPSDADKPVELTLYREDDESQLAGRAVTTSVGAQQCTLELVDLEPEPAARFTAEVTSLPVPPLLVCLDGDAAGTQRLRDLHAERGAATGGIAFTDEPAGTRYTLAADNDRFLLTANETGRLIQGAEGFTGDSAQYMLDVLDRIATWERTIALRNDATHMNTDDVQFRFYEAADRPEPFEHTGNDITIDVVEENGELQIQEVALKANNRTRQPLHFMLLAFSEDYGYRPIYNERVEPTETLFPVTRHPSFRLYLDEDEGNQIGYTFKLLVSTERVDDFLLRQDGLELGRIYAPAAQRGHDFGDGEDAPPKKLIHRNEWFTKDIHVRLVRQVDRVGEDDAAIANGQITIKGHPSLRADISLGAAQSSSRSVGSGSDIHRALERQGMELLNFSATRGESQSILELSGIENPEVLTEHPLEIELNVDLADDEFILPLTFDGEHILLTGDPRRNEAGRAEISIREIPDVDVGNERRSLGKALKLYFFKTVLKRDNVNRLCWVEYRDDGSAIRRDDGVADKVAAASSVLLLIHGIIGDTQGMAEGMKLARDEAGRSLSDKFDLVLTYDYESLSTPIADTTTALKRQLHDAGLHDADDKRLTLLVHSMGGLVSRWLIEREAGAKFVDRLIMCGTPNVGSPFGKIDGARKLSKLLTTLAINSFPAFGPVGGALIYILNKSEKLTPCLEQMNPDSDFITKLNDSEDPGIAYSILAADAREYSEDSDDLAASLIAKLGRGIIFDTLYRDAAHDIAVARQSILGVDDGRSPAPVKHSLIGHHLNYFTNEDSLQILAAIE